MNRGRNIFIVLMVMLAISVQFFFMLIGRDNDQGVVDNVRYVFKEGNLEDPDLFYYTFYYVDHEPMEATVRTMAGGSRRISIDGHDYVYIVNGTSKKDCDITWEYFGKKEGGGSDEEAFSLYTKKFFKSMIFGKDPFLRLYEAMIVSAVGAVGLAIYLNAEKLWTKYSAKKYPEDYEPVWADFRGFRKAGIATMAAAGVLLIIFIIF